MTLLLFTLVLTIIFSCLSTAILSYISMAVMLGPWIDSTIVLSASLLLSVAAHTIATLARQQSIACITIGASVGGIIATACGFAFPTLYFLDKEIFNAWLAQPFYFMAIMGILALCASAFGFLLSDLFEHQFMHVEQLSFPIGELSYKMISAQQSTKKAHELSFGFILSLLYSIAGNYISVIPKAMTVLPAITYRFFKLTALKISLGELPMLWSIGFIAGHSIAIPLGIGILAKNLICGPAHATCFTHLPFGDFLIAFAGGMVAYGALISFLTLPSAFKGFKGTKKEKNNGISLQKKVLENWIQWLTVMMLTGSFLHYFKFNILSQIYLLIGTAICTYQLLIIGGKIGIAPLARYATFVMMPGMLLFGYNAIQITLVSTFVEICGGVAVELLFGRKVGQLSSLPPRKVHLFQWLGIMVSALVIGCCFWILITHLGLGSAQLVAQRSQSRAFLVMVQSFDFFALILGALFASILKELKVNAIMVLGGILMPTELALPLVFGGLSSLLVKDKEDYYPFWSGIFAANSLWMFIKALL